LVGVRLEKGQRVDRGHRDLGWYVRHSALPRSTLVVGCGLETSTFLGLWPLEGQNTSRKNVLGRSHTGVRDVSFGLSVGETSAHSLDM
jgi:hypothetical protein